MCSIGKCTSNSRDKPLFHRAKIQNSMRFSLTTKSNWMSLSVEMFISQTDWNIETNRWPAFSELYNPTKLFSLNKLCTYYIINSSKPTFRFQSKFS